MGNRRTGKECLACPKNLLNTQMNKRMQVSTTDSMPENPRFTENLYLNATVTALREP